MNNLFQLNYSYPCRVNSMQKLAKGYIDALNFGRDLIRCTYVFIFFEAYVRCSMHAREFRQKKSGGLLFF